ncbi:YbaB/EbfC family nucleoid-associated protein [Amycolatopsis sp. TNS106]|uniref:YbaB/EbfC family nucleoid-associated protein n=1 Tax=Amycolatopsis sp. TNS106 TaxID=2861750 RepID=UPI0021072F7E|nr:YbaB/EbfC family nucleoid-associated protein [Amycolatopsis sp. TNS106]
METFADRKAGYLRTEQGLREQQRRMAEIRATAESDDGLIGATVGGYGELMELRLDPRVFRTPDSTGLAREITKTVHRAAELAHEEGFALVSELFPAGTTAAEADLRLGPALHELDRRIAGGER